MEYGVAAITALWRGGEADNVSRLYLREYFFK
jgi:hypothetical protein